MNMSQLLRLLRLEPRKIHLTSKLLPAVPISSCAAGSLPALDLSGHLADVLGPRCLGEMLGGPSSSISVFQEESLRFYGFGPQPDQFTTSMSLGGSLHNWLLDIFIANSLQPAKPSSKPEVLQELLPRLRLITMGGFLGTTHLVLLCCLIQND